MVVMHNNPAKIISSIYEYGYQFRDVYELKFEKK